MPRSSESVYEPAYESICSLAAQFGIEVKSISDILIEAVNENRLRMRGELMPFQGTREEHIRHPKRLTTGKIDFIPRDFFKSGWRVTPAYFCENNIVFRSALSDEFSNIYLAQDGSHKVTQVIANAHLLTSDRDKTLRKAFRLRGSTASAGAKRNDAIWGEVILHLIELQARKALSPFRTTEALVASVTSMHPDINPNTIRHVLQYVVTGLNQKRRAPAVSEESTPLRD